jgi:hypothetical protein
VYYIHVDVKERRRPIGWVADLCPICRDLRAFEVNELRRVARVYFVPLGRGSLEGREITCVDCQSVLQAPEDGYEALSPRRRDPAQLVPMTNPGLLDRAGDWFERQHLVAMGTLSRGERTGEIVSVLRALDHMAWMRSRGGPEELLTALCVVVFFVVLIGTVVSWSGSPGWRIACAAMAAGMLALSTTMVLTHRSMAAGRHMLPRLVRALEPLEPTLEELDAALQFAQRQGLRIGRYVTGRRLLRELARERDRPVVLRAPGAV